MGSPSLIEMKETSDFPTRERILAQRTDMARNARTNSADNTAVAMAMVDAPERDHSAAVMQMQAPAANP